MTKLNWVTKACGALLLWAVAAIALPAQTFTSLFSFDGTDGRVPYAALVQGINGSFYGATVEGGTTDGGTVFKITPSGTLTTVYNFEGIVGCSPYGSMYQDANGYLYGTTETCGASDNGSVFKISPSGALTTIYSFCSQTLCLDGACPVTDLVLGNDGNLYGATIEGGSYAVGTVFKITLSGALTTLYSFCSQPNCADGRSPYTPVQGNDGNFYGTTGAGGISGYCRDRDGCGTVYKLTPSGTLTILYNFCSQADCADGGPPDAMLVQGTDGNFYGATYSGGSNGAGTVFKITTGGALTTLHRFDETDGEHPDGGVSQGTDGNFYGTTAEGGGDGDGTIFTITPSGTLTTLHSFDGTGGGGPEGALVQGTDGLLYGTTEGGGASGVCKVKANG